MADSDCTLNVRGVQVKLWDPSRTRAIPECFWCDDSRRGAISSVRTFTFYLCCADAFVKLLRVWRTQLLTNLTFFVTYCLTSLLTYSWTGMTDVHAPAASRGLTSVTVKRSSANGCRWTTNTAPSVGVAVDAPPVTEGPWPGLGPLTSSVIAELDFCVETT